MGATALTMGLVGSALGAATSAVGAIAQGNQQRAQAEALSAQAEQTRKQAQLIEQKGAIEAQNLDARKTKLRRDFEALQGKNAVALGAGNVEGSTGSANDVALGNINMFANDLAENQYEVALKKWETAEQAKQARYQADLFDSKASLLQKTAGNVGTTLLTAGLGGAKGFLGGYQLGGGKISGLLGGAGKTGEKFWDRALQQWVSAPVRH